MHIGHLLTITGWHHLPARKSFWWGKKQVTKWVQRPSLKYSRQQTSIPFIIYSRVQWRGGWRNFLMALINGHPGSRKESQWGMTLDIAKVGAEEFWWVVLYKKNSIDLCQIGQAHCNHHQVMTYCSVRGTCTTDGCYCESHDVSNNNGDETRNSGPHLQGRLQIPCLRLLCQKVASWCSEVVM